MENLYTSDFLNLLHHRGYLNQCSDEAGLDQLAAKGTITAYIGFDCTAPSLHIGNLLGIMMLRKLQQTGHKPIVLIGAATTKIGDPSGKDESRQILSQKKIEENIQGIKKVFSNFLDFGNGPTGAIMLNNRDWLERLNYIEFLRDIGQHFSINRMLSFDSVKRRLEREQTLSFLEFNYMILQAYDFMELHKNHKCLLQMGGSDQWGNIINGIELIRRIENQTAYGLTTSLLTTASGAKMGKTAEGAVWLNAERLSVYDYWQFWRNTEDADVGKFLKMFTELPLDEIARLEALQGQEINDAKKILATEATAMAHGHLQAEKAAKTAQQTFEGTGLSQDLPAIEIARTDIEAGLGLLIALNKAGLASSNGEARRHIKGGGVRINDVPVEDQDKVLNLDDLNPDQVIKLSLGKKKHVLIKVPTGRLKTTTRSPTVETEETKKKSP